jgi:branched-chain amino acid transport system ATP-binding protein
MSNSLLSTTDLSISYGAVKAVRGSNLEVKEGEVVALLGPNGAGKSSTLRAIVGLIKSQGSVNFAGHDVTGLPTERIVSLGLSLVPEGRRLFPNLTVSENLMLGAPRKAKSDDLFDELLDRLPILRERLQQVSGTLSGGEQQQVAIARALMSRPKLLLIDEPSLGLAPTIVDAVYQLLSDLRKTGLAMIIVEQEVMRVLKFADRAYAMSTGEIALEGSAADLSTSDEVKRVYLGGAE